MDWDCWSIKLIRFNNLIFKNTRYFILGRYVRINNIYVTLKLVILLNFDLNAMTVHLLIVIRNKLLDRHKIFKVNGASRL